MGALVPASQTFDPLMVPLMDPFRDDMASS
jgi:hypothetical protein